MFAFSLRVLAPSLVAAVLLLGNTAARAQTYVERVYVPTSTSILVEPTSYYVPTSSVVYAPTSAVYATTSVLRPTSYYVPTRYVASSSILSTSYYVPSSYVVQRTGFLGLGRTSYYVPSSSIRSTSYYVPTSATFYRPTRYYLPTTTTLAFPTLSSATVCCDSQPVAVYDAPVVSERVISSDEGLEMQEIPPSASARSSANSGSSASPSGASSEPALNSNVLRSQPTNGTSQPATPPAAPESSGLSQPPAQEPDPVPAPPASEVVPPPVTPGELPPPVVAPAAPSDLPGVAPAAPELINPSAVNGVPDFQEARRPALRDEDVRRVETARSTLIGRVISAVSGKPESGVAVVVTDFQKRFRDRLATTDANGEFEVVLPEGDWTVSVPRVSGGGQNIERSVTVGGGLITDDQNREVTRLTINR